MSSAKSRPKTILSESDFRAELLAEAHAGREKCRSLGLPTCDEDPQAPDGLLFEKYGATVYELAFASDYPDRVCSRVARALAAYLAERGDAHDRTHASRVRSR